MRVAIDLQPCQAANLADPGGRYALALLPQLLTELAAQAVEIHLLANLELAGSLSALRELVARSATARPIWHTVRLPVTRAVTPPGAWARAAAGLMRDSAIAAIEPHVELVLDAAAGWADEVAVSPAGEMRGHARVLVLAAALPHVLGAGVPSASRAEWEQTAARRLRAADRVLGLQGLPVRSALAAGVEASRLTELPADAAPATVLVAAAVFAAATHLAPVPAPPSPRRPRLAYVSPLPPAASGIADYSAELLPALAHHYEIELIVEQQEPLPAALTEVFPVRSAAWLRAHAESYDRILYHFGNSPFHAHMVDLLRRHAGTVVLHDCFLGHLFGHLQHSGLAPEALRQALYRSHGYAALALRRTAGEAAAIAAYPCNLEVLASAQGVIVHSAHARTLLHDWYGDGLDVPIHQTGLAHASPDPAARDAARAVARRALGLGEDDVLVCSFGYVGAGKLSRELVQAWLRSPLAEDPACRLVLVGGHQMRDGYAEELTAEVARASASGVKITGYVPLEAYRQYLAAADVAVQLRANSRGETSRAVFDAMAHGVALIVNAHGSSVELPDETAIKLADACTVEALSAALEACVRDPVRRAAMAAAADHYVRQAHDPVRIAACYRDAIEAAAATAHTTYAGRTRAVFTALAGEQARLGWRPTRHEAARVARMLADNHAPAALRRLLPDVSLLRPRLHWTDRGFPPARERRGGALRSGGADLLAVRGLMLLPEAATAPVAGSGVRAAQLRRVYAEAGMTIELAHHDVFAGGELRSDWDQWSAAQVSALADRLRAGRYDFVQLERGLLWPLYRAAAADLQRDTPLPCLVYSSHRDEAVRAGVDRAPAVAACECELARTANLLLVPHLQEAERLMACGAPVGRVRIFGNGGQVPEAAWRDSEQVYREYLPQRPYGLIVSDGDAAAADGFFRMLGESLAYLPPDAVLVVAGGLSERLQMDWRFQRWAGINGSRCVLIGRPDALGLAALRRHAHMLVLPRAACRGDSGPDIKTAEALQDGHRVLATSAAMHGYESVAHRMLVHIEDEPASFRQALAAGLVLPPRPVAAAPVELGWHHVLAGVAEGVRAAIGEHEGADHA